ncbi:MAG TPA: hypothetical protein VFY23_09155 [Candidatus Limnocylindrales bacterium]|nr:hypothetical protein [Candidatus Limnocylindrales bacterium]
MRIRPAVFGALAIAIFFGAIGIAMAGGAWSTTGRTTSGGGRVELARGAAVTDVKGWMAVGDVADAYAIPLPELLDAFALPTDTKPSTPLKELESDTFSVAALREWLTTRAPDPDSDGAP